MASTHTLIFGEGTKRNAAWDRGEPRREWAALRHIYHHAPDLVPTPVAVELDDVPPTVTMTIVPGQPLTTELSTAQASGLATAIRGLWAVPVDDAHDVPPWSDARPQPEQLPLGRSSHAFRRLRGFGDLRPGH